MEKAKIVLADLLIALILSVFMFVGDVLGANVTFTLSDYDNYYVTNHKANPSTLYTVANANMAKFYSSVTTNIKMAVYVYKAGDTSSGNEFYRLCDDGSIKTDSMFDGLIVYNDISTSSIKERSTSSPTLADVVNGNLVYYPTNIPIFKSSQDAKNYLKTGDASGAVNYNTLPGVLQYDSSVELPQNLVCTKHDSKNDQCYFEWKQSDSTDLTGYTTQIWRKPTYSLKSFLPGSQFGKTYNMGLDISMYKEVTTNYVNRELVDTMETTQDDYKLLQTQYSNINFTFSSCTLDHCDYYVRNVKDGKLVSNWVKVQYTNQGWYVRGNDQDVNAGAGSYSEVAATDSTGNVSKDPSGNATKPDSPYNPTYTGDTGQPATTGSITDWLKNGFGLLGDDGLLALMSRTFNFIPTQIIALLMFSFGVVAIIIVVRFLK